MTTYAKLLRAAATLKRVQAGLDALAARARDDRERDRLERAAAQARVMSQGLERRIRQVQAQEPQYAREAPGAPDGPAAQGPASEPGEEAQDRSLGGPGLRGAAAEPEGRQPADAGGEQAVTGGARRQRPGKRQATASQRAAVTKENARSR